ncbi:MAG: DUF4394 domain-containing protein [Pseudomonadota bacterium]|nr:DUF4394 domain-containing protein [Pseudomonadota bacterium]
MVYGIRGDDELVRFSPSAPGSVLSLGAFPTAAGDVIVGLDRRPSDNKLYAVSRLGAVFTAEVASSANPSLMATLIQPIMGPTPPPIGRIGTDFNPAADALRIVADDGTNLRVPAGALTSPESVPPVNTLVDGRMGYKQGVTAAAYSNPHPDFVPPMGEPATQLFVLDSQNDALYLQAANEGELSFVASLNVDINVVNGYDIYQGEAADANEHFVVTASGANTRLYELDPTTGIMTLLTTLEGVSEARGLIVVENAAPTGPLAPPLRAFVLDSSGDADVIKSFAFNRQPFDIGTPVTTLAITGLMTGERLVGIDSRTTSRDTNRVDTIYAITTLDRVVALVEVTGDALAVSDTATLSTPLAGTSFAVDFNPSVDLLRILSDDGQNLRVNLDVGREIEGEARPRGFAFVDRTTRVVLPDEGTELIAKLPPQIVATAYRAAPVNGTFQYAIDAENSSLVRVVVPNDGALERVGPLGSGLILPRNTATTAPEQSLDIAGTNDSHAYAALRLNEANRSALYSVNLETGAVTLIGTIGAAGSEPVGSITVRFE